MATLGFVPWIPLRAQANTSVAPRPAVRLPQDHRPHAGVLSESWLVYAVGSAGGRQIGFQLRIQTGPGKGASTTAMAMTDLVGKRFVAAPLEAHQLQPIANHWQASVSSKDAASGMPLQADLVLRTTQAPILHGEHGRERFGPLPHQVRWHYALPQLEVTGTLEHPWASGKQAFKGRGWISHEWRQDAWPTGTQGHDTVTMNFGDGGCLLAWMLRNAEGRAVWDGGIYRSPKGDRFAFNKGAVLFSRQRSHRSTITQANYPAEWIVRTPADFHTVRASTPQQELQATIQPPPAIGGAKVGVLSQALWTGFAELLNSNGGLEGWAHLEMTGYARSRSV
jgi:predicted secreted hydrolase